LTAARLGPGDALLCGLADHFVTSNRLAGLQQAMSEKDRTQAVQIQSQPAPPGQLATQREWIDAFYTADSVEEILLRLQARDEPEARSAAQAMLTKSPTALKVTLRALRQARRLGTLEQVLDQEYRTSSTCLRSPYLIEGIRAMIVDKTASLDGHPHGSRMLTMTTSAVISHHWALRSWGWRADAGRPVGSGRRRGG
jgi:enoyl-CoA hydratase/carnithine racemase